MLGRGLWVLVVGKIVGRGIFIRRSRRGGWGIGCWYGGFWKLSIGKVGFNLLKVLLE